MQRWKKRCGSKLKEGQISQKTVTHQIKLLLPLTIILGLIAFGLIANVLKPIVKVESAFAYEMVNAYVHNKRNKPLFVKVVD